jgi:MFS family permease
VILRNLFSPLFAGKASLSQGRTQRMHFWSIVIIFIGLGFYVGVWTVLVADLTNALRLSPALLGFALSCFSATGIVLLLLGSSLAEHFTRRLILLLGVGGLGIFFAALAFVSSYALLLIIVLFGGACASCYDLAVNSIAGDYERHYGSKSMTLFHAGFSGGATLGAIVSAIALADGIGFRAIYAATAVLFLLLAVVACALPLPAVGLATSIKETDAAPSSSQPQPSLMMLLAIPVMILATALVSLSFFTDGTLEGFTSVYLRNLLGSGALLGGMGIAAFYLIGMIGRLSSTAALRRYGERSVITMAGMLSALGMIVALATTSAPLAVGGLLLVGLGQAPLVPTAFSLAARVGAHQGARAVAIVTAFGYTVFLISPLLIGLLAALLSLRIALLLTIVTSAGVMLIAQRLPGTHH